MVRFKKKSNNPFFVYCEKFALLKKVTVLCISWYCEKQNITFYT